METNQETGMGAGTGTGTGAGRATDETIQKVREVAGEAGRKVEDQLRSSMDTGRTRAAETLGSFAQALSRSGQQLRSENQGALSEFVERAGDQLRRASDYLRNTDVDELTRNTEDLARRQPALFLGGVFAIGVVAGRLLKSAQQARAEQSKRKTALVPQTVWTGDRERPVSGFREPQSEMGGGSWDNPTDPSYTQQFRRDVP